MLLHAVKKHEYNVNELSPYDAEMKKMNVKKMC